MLRIRFTPADLSIDDKALAAGIAVSAARVANFFEARGVLADELSPVPRRRSFPGDYPLEWSDRQRRAYFAKVRAGKTTFPYRRTGALSQGWALRASKLANGARLTLSNETDYARWVVGSMGSDQGQQRFHAITGWQPLADRMPGFLDRLEVSIQEELQRTLGSEVIGTR